MGDVNCDDAGNEHVCACTCMTTVFHKLLYVDMCVMHEYKCVLMYVYMCMIIPCAEY